MVLWKGFPVLVTVSLLCLCLGSPARPEKPQTCSSMEDLSQLVNHIRYPDKCVVDDGVVDQWGFYYVNGTCEETGGFDYTVNPINCEVTT